MIVILSSSPLQVARRIVTGNLNAFNCEAGLIPWSRVTEPAVRALAALVRAL
jgi:hypothetical protein